MVNGWCYCVGNLGSLAWLHLIAEHSLVRVCLSVERGKGRESLHRPESE